MDSQISDRLKVMRVPILKKRFGYLQLVMHDRESDWYVEVEVEQNNKQSPAIISARVAGRASGSMGSKVSFPVAPTLVLTSEELARVKNWFRGIYESQLIVFGYQLDPSTYLSEHGTKIYFCGDKSLEDFAERAKRGSSDCICTE